jgi:hypothetical protein
MSGMLKEHTSLSRGSIVPLCSEPPLDLLYWVKPPAPSFVVSSTTFSNCLPGIQIQNSLRGSRIRGTSISRSERRCLRLSEHSFGMRLQSRSQTEGKSNIEKA